MVENVPPAFRALAVYRAGSRIGFADALIAESTVLAGATRTVTFDKKAAAETRMESLRLR